MRLEFRMQKVATGPDDELFRENHFETSTRTSVLGRLKCPAAPLLPTTDGGAGDANDSTARSRSGTEFRPFPCEKLRIFPDGQLITSAEFLPFFGGKSQKNEHGAENYSYS
jgi:hypothetical protein